MSYVRSTQVVWPLGTDLPNTIFFSKNQIMLAQTQCSYFFSGFQAHLFLFCSCDNCQLSLIFDGRLHRNLMPLYNLLYEVSKHYLNFVILLFARLSKNTCEYRATYSPYIFAQKIDNFSEDKFIARHDARCLKLVRRAQRARKQSWGSGGRSKPPTKIFRGFRCPKLAYNNPKTN